MLVAAGARVCVVAPRQRVEPVPRTGFGPNEILAVRRNLLFLLVREVVLGNDDAGQ